MMEETHFSETTVLIRATRYHFPEHGIIYSHRCENLKSYITPFCASVHGAVSIYNTTLTTLKNGETDALKMN
jgi:hypothetical protein